MHARTHSPAPFAKLQIKAAPGLASQASRNPDPIKQLEVLSTTREMKGYSNIASSPPMAAANGPRARRSLELTNTKETHAWEGLAIGAVTLARTVSTGSHRLCRSGEKSKGGGGGGHGLLPGALRRAFSMRRHPAAHGKGDGYYWRIHDMDGDSERGDDNACEERDDEEGEEKKGWPEEGEVKKEDEGKRTTKKKRGSDILKACKKLLRLSIDRAA